MRRWEGVKRAIEGDVIVNGQSSQCGRLAAAGLTAVGVAAFVTVSMTSTMATSTAAPPSTDQRGFVDSTARCAAPSEAVAFGYTSNSRVAICKDESSGQYQYRGVRVADGARLILAATSTSGGYVAENQGITYTVTAAALVITSGGQQIRREPMLDFHGSAPGSSPGSSPSASPAPSSSARPTQPSAVPDTVTPTTPLPPPLPAEIGGH